MINVTKTFLPPIEEYENYIKKIWQNCYVTNQGPLLFELQKTLSKFLNIENFHYISNGTIALQIALKALEIEEGEIITTPFSYIATSSAILWEKLTPVYVDIEPNNFTIDTKKIEEKITNKTRAIMPVHVFGYACNIEEIDTIAKKYNLKVIYDAAHAFASEYKDKSLLSFGDISTCSFHATKLFHTIEGGACVCKDDDVSQKLEFIKRFGHNKDEHITLGINAKQSEFHAAMGLAIFPHIKEIIQKRKNISEHYDSLLKNKLQRPAKQAGKYNYAYYPVLFESEKQLLNVFKALEKKAIFPRRYFYPSLNTINYIKKDVCPISEDISKRIACLPIYPDLVSENIEIISKTILENL